MQLLDLKFPIASGSSDGHGNSKSTALASATGKAVPDSENSVSTPGNKLPWNERCSAAIRTLRQLGKRSKGASVRFSLLRRLENRPLFARIGIKPEDQELCGERA